MKSSPRAFTLIELIIVVGIFAILSVALLVNFKGSITDARLEKQVTQIVHMLEEARTYSLSNFLVDDTEPANYYVVTITTSGATLKVYGASQDSTLDTIILQTGFTITGISSPERIFYFPPTGEICFDSVDCTSSDKELTLTVTDDSGAYTQDIYFNKFGGAPEVVN